MFAELAAVSAGGPADYTGITYARLESEGGLFWPCPLPDHPGTPYPFIGGYAHPDGRARFAPVAYREAGEAPDAEYPLLLTTGRVRAHYQSGNQTRRLARSLERRRNPSPNSIPRPRAAPDCTRAIGAFCAV